MKRQLLFLVLAGGLALMAAPSANAGKPAKAPGYCGKNYAMLMTGNEPSITPALGSAAGCGVGAEEAIDIFTGTRSPRCGLIKFGISL